MEGSKKPLIHALKTRTKTLTRKKVLTTAATINQVIQNEEKSTVFSNRLTTVTLGASTMVTGREFHHHHIVITYPRLRNRTNCYKSFIHHALLKYQAYITLRGSMLFCHCTALHFISCVCCFVLLYSALLFV